MLSCSVEPSKHQVVCSLIDAPAVGSTRILVFFKEKSTKKVYKKIHKSYVQISTIKSTDYCFLKFINIKKT